MKTTATGWQDWASFALGLWLALSPWICGYAEDQHAATGNAAFMGIALALGAHFQASLDAHSAMWLHFAGGAWLAAAPFVLGFTPVPLAATCSIAVGAAVAALAASALVLHHGIGKRLGTSWHAIRR